ncbi:RsiV family protein [uncultured Dysosmobacter sp.]|uniref:RsiV family protein n=1 Tax=uncultured Dysosmobacter sp. TaxID=2591384 RepID=UPI00260E570E|nr:RsiV family protein [uncultured Dysosmobacter sp.]
MDQFDKMLKERAKEEPFPLPEGYAGRVFAACAALDEHERARKKPRLRWTGWTAAALALFIAVPNVSPAAAAAMANVPGLGAIVELITLRRYTYDDGHKSAEITVPELGGSEAAGEVSEQVRAYTDQLIARFEEDRRKADGGEYHGLDVAYDIVTNTDRWFTLRIDTTETQASGYETSRFYHIDKATGEVVTLKDLFREDADYAAALSGEVRRQMEEDESETYFPEEFTAVDPEQNFYWNGDGELVLVFDEYTVAPGSMGMPEFTIPADVYGSLLK